MSRRRTLPSARPAFRPQFEILEERRVMSAALVGGDIVIDQTNLSDAAVVTRVQIGGVQDVIGVDDTRVPTPNGQSVIRVDELLGGVPQAPRFFPASAVTGRIVYNGLGGDDRFENRTSLRSVAFGGAGDDVLIGGLTDDLLYGGLDDDHLLGREGGDTLYGEGGDDRLSGDGGDDRPVGGAGRDSLYGGRDNDLLDGSRDGMADVLTGGGGADTFVEDPVVFSQFVDYNRDRPTDYQASEGDRIL